MKYIKISLDISIYDIFNKIINYNKKGGINILFFNNIDGISLNKETIYKVIFFIEKANFNINYLFYNVPFCLFKVFGENFIKKHCINNRLCNYYKGYIDLGKCNKCKYGLFCNNFNSHIDIMETKFLKEFGGTTINNIDFISNFIGIYIFFIDLGYKEEDIIINSRQKFFLDFLKGKEINKIFLKYLTLTIYLDNKKLNKKLFKISVDIFKDQNLSIKFIELQRKHGINILLYRTIGGKIKYYDILYDKYKIKFYDNSSNLREPPFFDFDYDSFFINKNVNYFEGISKNRGFGTIIGKACLIKNANDFLYNIKGDIYVGKDIFSGFNINNFRAILITSDASSEHIRLDEISSDINIPIITNIKPNITEYIKNGSKLEIDFDTGIINMLQN